MASGRTPDGDHASVRIDALLRGVGIVVDADRDTTVPANDAAQAA
ncbi:hypothetical protein [Paraburkholderia caffeinilytica]|nr:hypothetical protein [Paraburkholderia caffeinilytica]